MIERLKVLLEKSKEGLTLDEVKEISPLLSDELKDSMYKENYLIGLSLGLLLFKVDCIILDSMESEKK